MMEPGKTLTTRKPGGEYSTVRLPDGVIETVWFGDDGNDMTVGRTYQGLRDIAEAHIKAFELQKAADDELMARPADRDDIDEAEAAEEDVKLVRRVGEWRELTAAGRVYVHSLRMSAED